MGKKILSVFFLIICFSSFTFSGTTGKLTGTVIDEATNEPLPFVNITIEGTMLGAASDIDGKYVILNIPPGTYRVKFQSIGYQPVVVSDIKISIDLTTEQNISLKPTTVEMDAIVVEGKQEAIKKDVTSSEARVSADDIKNLPVSEINDVLQLQSGVTKDAGGGFHIRGGRSSEIAYWVNGVSITDAYDNSRGIDIDNSSVQEVQVISGTFNAEYGQALSGIVNTVTKEGQEKYNGNIKIYSSDYVSNFTSHFYGIDQYNPFANYNFQGSLSGPVPFTSNRLRFFANARYNYDDGYIYGIRKFNTDGSAGDGELVPMNWSKRYIGQFNISYFASKYFKFRLEGLYSKENYQDYTDENAHQYRLEPDGNVKKYSNSYNTTLSMTHTFSNTAFYEAKISYFSKDFKEHLYDDPFDSRYMHPDSLNLVGYAFHSKGTNLHRFYRETNTLLGKVDFTAQIGDNHLVKFGVEGRFHTLKFDDYDLEPLRIDGVPVEPFQPAIPLATSNNRTKYDEKPLEYSAYVQDKIEFQSVIINIGLRLDYFNSYGEVPVDQTDPNIYIPLRSDMVSKTIAQRMPYYYKKADPKWQLGPRFGIAYPISSDGVIHFSYGHFLQVPTFQYLFQNGPYYVPESGSNYGPYGNPDLKPQKTIMYEIGFRQDFLGILNVDVTGFYRDIRNWITASAAIETRNLVTYSMFINKDYSNVRGLTLNLKKQFTNHWSFDLNYTFQVAEGSNSSPEDEFNAIKDNKEPALYLTSLDWDQRHLLNANLYVGSNDWGVSLLARYGTGLPYTPSITQYTSDRGISSGLQRNSRVRPSQFTMDLMINKIFTVFEFDLNVYAKIFNLLDNRVVVNVFGDTGKADYTTEGQNVGEDPNRPNTVAEYQNRPWFYGPPREVQLGLDISF